MTCTYIVINADIGATLKYRDLLHNRPNPRFKIFREAVNREFLQCAQHLQGRNIEGTTKFLLINHHIIPHNKTEKYTRFVVR